MESHSDWTDVHEEEAYRQYPSAHLSFQDESLGSVALHFAEFQIVPVFTIVIVMVIGALMFPMTPPLWSFVIIGIPNARLAWLTVRASIIFYVEQPGNKKKIKIIRRPYLGLAAGVFGGIYPIVWWYVLYYKR